MVEEAKKAQNYGLSCGDSKMGPIILWLERRRHILVTVNIFEKTVSEAQNNSYKHEATINAQMSDTDLLFSFIQIHERQL